MISARMATFPARENRLLESLERLAPQVDEILLCLNEYESVPAEVSKMPKVHAIIPRLDAKDTGKFMFNAEPHDHVFLVDDDIEYPSDYVSRTLDSALATGMTEKAIFGYHGTIYRRFHLKRRTINALLGRGLGPYPPGALKDLYPYYAALLTPRIVSQLGTGTVYCLGENLPSFSIMEDAQKRVDVRLASWAAGVRKPMISLPRAKGWMPSTGDDETSIYHNFTRHLPSEMTAEIASFCYRVPGAGRRLKGEAD